MTIIRLTWSALIFEVPTMRVVFLHVLAITLWTCSSDIVSADDRERSTVKPRAIYPFIKDGKVGYIDVSGNTAIKPTYSPLNRVAETGAALPSTTKLPSLFSERYLSQSHRTTSPPWGVFKDGLALVRVGDRVGYIDHSGRVVIKPSFILASDFRNGYAWVAVGHVYGSVTPSTRYFLIDTKGRRVSPKVEAFADDLTNPLVSVRIDGKWGLMARNGKIMVKPFSTARIRWSESLGVFKKQSKYGVVDSSGAQIVKATFDEIRPFKEGFAAVRQNGKWGAIDVNGKMTLECRFGFVYLPFTEGVVPVKSGGKIGYADITGQMVVSARFDMAYKFENGVAWVSVGGKMGLIRKDGKFIVRPRFVDASEFQEGVSIVSVKGKTARRYGLISRRGRVIVEPLYRWIGEIGEGMAVYQGADSKYGFIDLRGNIRIKPRYDFCTSFQDGTAHVRVAAIPGKNPGKVGIVNRSGSFVVEPRYYHVGPMTNGLRIVQDERGKEGYVDRGGEMVIRAEFDAAFPFDANGVALVNIEGNWKFGREFDYSGKWGYIDRNGRWIWKPSK